MYFQYVVLLLIPYVCANENSTESSDIIEATEISVSPLTSTETPTATATTTTPTTISLNSTENPLIPCTCGIFLSGSFKRGCKDPPSENPALSYEQTETFACTSVGNKLCTNKCLDNIVKHLPNSPNILCGSIDRDCNKERAYLFVKNCKDEWINTNLSAGREYCCKDGLPYKCPKNTTN